MTQNEQTAYNNGLLVGLASKGCVKLANISDWGGVKWYSYARAVDFLRSPYEQVAENYAPVMPLQMNGYEFVREVA